VAIIGINSWRPSVRAAAIASNIVEKNDGRLRDGGGVNHMPDALFALTDKLGEELAAIDDPQGHRGAPIERLRTARQQAGGQRLARPGGARQQNPILGRGPRRLSRVGHQEAGEGDFEGVHIGRLAGKRVPSRRIVGQLQRLGRWRRRPRSIGGRAAPVVGRAAADALLPLRLWLLLVLRARWRGPASHQRTKGTIIYRRDVVGAARGRWWGGVGGGGASGGASVRQTPLEPAPRPAARGGAGGRAPENDSGGRRRPAGTAPRPPLPRAGAAATPTPTRRPAWGGEGTPTPARSPPAPSSRGARCLSTMLTRKASRHTRGGGGRARPTDAATGAVGVG